MGQTISSRISWMILRQFCPDVTKRWAPNHSLTVTFFLWLPCHVTRSSIFRVVLTSPLVFKDFLQRNMSYAHVKMDHSDTNETPLAPKPSKTIQKHILWTLKRYYMILLYTKEGQYTADCRSCLKSLHTRIIILYNNSNPKPPRLGACWCPGGCGCEDALGPGP